MQNACRMHTHTTYKTEWVLNLRFETFGSQTEAITYTVPCRSECNEYSDGENTMYMYLHVAKHATLTRCVSTYQNRERARAHFPMLTRLFCVEPGNSHESRFGAESIHVSRRPLQLQELPQCSSG